MTKRSREPLLIGAGILIFFVLAGLALFSLTRLVRSGYVGLVTMDGMILEDRATIIQLHKMQDNPLVKAIVIHINSPGGTLASAQSIFEEIQKIRQQGKPVVVSMAEVCASGGFYVACGADRVFANAGSITGSIGIILRYPEAGELMKKLGLGMEIVKSGAFKDLGDFSRKMTKKERRLMQAMINDLHDQFVETVLDTRGDKLARALAQKRGVNITDLKPESVKRHLRGLADGRVFSGRQAHKLGLIDHLGNLDDAVEMAARLGQLRGKPKVLKEKGPTFLQQLLRGAARRPNELLGGETGIDFKALLLELWRGF